MILSLPIKFNQVINQIEFYQVIDSPTKYIHYLFLGSNNFWIVGQGFESQILFLGNIYLFNLLGVLPP